MTKLDQVLTRLAALPTRRQEEIAEVITQIIDLGDATKDVPAWQIEELKSRLSEPDDFADEEEIEAVFQKG